MKRLTTWTGVAFVALVSTIQSAPSSGVTVTNVSVTDLGTLGGLESMATAINEAGDIVGWSLIGSGVKHAFLYQGGVMQDIGGARGMETSQANGINNHGTIVGSGTDQGFEHGLYWQGGGVFRLPDTLNSAVAQRCQYWSAAHAVNDQGSIVGMWGLKNLFLASNCGYPIGPLLWQRTPAGVFYPPASITRENRPDEAMAYDINNWGTIVGYSKAATSNEAAQWTTPPGTTSIPPPQPVPGRSDLHWALGQAYGVSDGGVVVGRFQLVQTFQPATTPPIWSRHAFVWDGLGTTSRALGLPPRDIESEAQDINDTGVIAGSARIASELSIPTNEVPTEIFDNGNPHFHRPIPWTGVIWSESLGVFALPTLTGSGDCAAFALNNEKATWKRTQLIQTVQIAGFCTVNGFRRAVRWDVTTGQPLVLVPR